MTAGAVLCGGASRRMGTDKAFIEVDGVPMVARVADALAAGGCDPVVLVGGDVELLSRFGRPVVADRFPGQGPAGGVLTALDAADAELIVVASCDLAWLDASTVASVAAGLDDPAVQAAVAVTDRWQLSLSAWCAAARPELWRAWIGGTRSMRALVAAVRHVEVPVPAVAVVNVNTPADLSAAHDASR